jgi:aminoglycoside phosphotransferase (APT) family kinase protein
MPQKLSADDARAFLRDHGHEASELAPLTGGLWSTTFAFREKRREYVVRFHERRDDLEKDQLAERWRSPTLRVPHMVEIGDHGSGGYGIAERVAGAPLDDLDHVGMRRILPSLFAAMDAMRDADLTGTTGFGLWHGDGRAEHATWPDNLVREDPPGERGAQRERLRQSALGNREFDFGLTRMHELMPYAPAERFLVHNDLLNFNVLVDEGGVILLDWGASIFGDFLYDAALLTFWWPWYANRWGPIDIRREIEHHYRAIDLDVPHFRERLRLCELDIGISHIAFQVARGEREHSKWTARRTADLAERDLGNSG